MLSPVGGVYLFALHLLNIGILRFLESYIDNKDVSFYDYFRYAMFLFSKQHEELVGVYASQLSRHLCIDLFVHMMEEKINERCPPF